MKFLVTISLLLLLSQYTIAQLMGGPGAGMAEAGAPLQDAWSVFYNVGGLPWVKKTTALAGYENRFGFSEGLHAAAVGVVKPLDYGTASLSIYRFGDALYSEDRLSLGFGHRVSQFSFGLRLNGHQYHIETLGTRFTTTIDVGGVAQLSPELTFGMQITNITQTKKTKDGEERIPSRLQTGLAYRPTETFRLVGEAEYEVQQTINAKIGAEYTVLKKVSFRSGIQTAYFQQFFGLGLAHRLLQMDYALRNHAELGWSHQLSLAYQWQH